MAWGSLGHMSSSVLREIPTLRVSTDDMRAYWGSSRWQSKETEHLDRDLNFLPWITVMLCSHWMALDLEKQPAEIEGMLIRPRLGAVEMGIFLVLGVFKCSF